MEDSHDIISLHGIRYYAKCILYVCMHACCADADWTVLKEQCGYTSQTSNLRTMSVALALGNDVADTIFNVVGMTRPGGSRHRTRNLAYRNR